MQAAIAAARPIRVALAPTEPHQRLLPTQVGTPRATHNGVGGGTIGPDLEGELTMVNCIHCRWLRQR